MDFKTAAEEKKEKTFKTTSYGWDIFFSKESQEDYYLEILRKLKSEFQQGSTVYPPKSQIFEAYRQCPITDIRVVILGQDPYHGPEQAHGLAFSVLPSCPIPPSLRNIFQEIKRDLNIPIPKHGHLAHWARQGVFLLNTCLTVRAGQAHSHANFGWERWVRSSLRFLCQQEQPLVVMLWGRAAQGFSDLFDPQKHLILTSTHPSPLSAHQSHRSIPSFMGCGHFGLCNAYLKHHHLPMIDWSLGKAPDNPKKDGGSEAFFQS